MECPNCGSSHICKNGKRGEKQNHICVDCGRQFNDIAVATWIRTNQKPKEGSGAPRRLSLLVFMSYSFPTIEIDIQNQELALRRFAPQRLIFHWEGSNKTDESYIQNQKKC